MKYDTLAVQLHIDSFTLPNDCDFDWSEEHVMSLITQAMATTDQELETPIQFKTFSRIEILKGKV